MILPKEIFDKIDYFEHTVEHKTGMEVYDVFTIHFKDWWRRKRVIKIKRISFDYDKADGTFRHEVTPSAADLYNQLNKWAISTFDEKLDSVKKKYITEDGSNIITLKSKPKDMDDESN